MQLGDTWGAEAPPNDSAAWDDILARRAGALVPAPAPALSTPSPAVVWLAIIAIAALVWAARRTKG